MDRRLFRRQRYEEAVQMPLKLRLGLSERRRTASSSISESTEKSNASVRSWCTGSCARPEEPVRFAARTQPKSHRRMKNQPTKPTPSQECTRFGPKCFVKWAMRNVPVFEEKTRPIIEASVASSFGTGSIHSKPLPHKKRWPGLQIKTCAPVWTAAVKI